MKVQTNKIENLALNDIELKAAELIAKGDKASAIFMLDDQLEYDPSRAEIASMLAQSANAGVYKATFDLIAMYHRDGDPDAYMKGQFPGCYRAKKESERKLQALIPPPSYKESEKELRAKGKKVN